MAWVNSTFFFALYPGYFAYHWAAINGWIPYTLGGYVNEISIIALISYIAVTFFQSASKYRLHLKLTGTDIFFLIFMMWFICIVLLNAVIDTAPTVTKSHISSVVQMIACFIVMRFVAFERVRKLSLILVLLYSAIILWSAQSDLIGLSTLLHSDDELKAANHQSLSRAFLLTAAFGLTGILKNYLRWIAYVFSILALFILGARSEIFGAFIFFIVFEIIYSQRPLIFFAKILICIFILIISIYFAFDFLQEIFPNNRLILLLLDFGSDGSLVEREIYQKMAWQTVLDKPLQGDYGHYARTHSSGAYAHNWLRAWVDLGLVGLLLFALIYLAPIILVSQILLKKIPIKDINIKRYFSLSFGLFFVFTIFSLTVKDFADTGLPIALGTMVSLQINYLNKI